MATALETDKSSQSAAAPNFWKRQFGLNPTLLQIVFDVTFGAILPIVCLYFDPGILRWGGLPGTSRLTHFGTFAYLEIALCIAALVFFLATRRASPFLAGILYAGMGFSLVVGLSILPLTIAGLFVPVGLLGLTPFFTSFVFLRNARRTWSRSARKTFPAAVLVSVSAAVLTVAVPFATQFAAARITANALVTLQSGSDADAARATHRLRFLRFSIDTDRLAIAYANTADPKMRDRLARAYLELTGEKVEDRLAILND